MSNGIIKIQKTPKGRMTAIIRHGQTKLNVEDRIRGWSNIPLDEVGWEQARELGREIKEKGIELDGLISSDLMRSVQTSLAISQETGIPILGTTKVLRPWDVGELTAGPGPEVHKVLAEHARNNAEELVGETGESFDIFRYRILGGIIGILNSNRGLKIGLVSHSRGERILHAWIAAGCPDDLSIDLDVFLEHGVGTATMDVLTIDSNLVLS